MYKKTGINIMFFLMFSVTIFAQNHEGKKLIEFGWDYPTSSFIKENIQQMQTQPFDGVVFSFNSGIYNAFDTSSLNDSSFDFEILSKIKWQNLSDNFLFMRGASYSGPH